MVIITKGLGIFFRFILLFHRLLNIYLGKVKNKYIKKRGGEDSPPPLSGGQ